MKTDTLEVRDGLTVPVCRVHTLVIGSGAAGLNAAVQLDRQGVGDVLIVTEGLQMGTSINTGSDKQTYYKLGMCGAEDDSPEALAESFFAGGSMHGDLAMVEASLSARCFLNLVNLGVAFPRDRFGQFVGYKTDHDPRQRATSVGPYTSKQMCENLIREVKRRGLEVQEKRVVVRLLVAAGGGVKRAVGAIALNCDEPSAAPTDVAGLLTVYLAENVVFAAGGPGGLYKTSVYPEVHTGGIGLALMEGARAQSLPESQYGLASTKFRWNVSGTYMQVVPRLMSTAADGVSDEQEFLRPYFRSAGETNSAVFLKGYQWPFDSRKIVGGSSIVDILVYIETVLRGRRAFLDFRGNPADFSFDELSEEAREYLAKSEALLDRPIERLRKMNPAAIALYGEHGIDITKEPLEIAVCAQHNNGGLAGNLWWESVNVQHLFPVGEVNGSHGVYRPGGSALNSGQVAGFRAAEYIAERYREATLDADAAQACARSAVQELAERIGGGAGSAGSWQDARGELMARMSKAGAHIRSREALREAVGEAWAQWQRMQTGLGAAGTVADLAELLRNRQLCFAHAVYLEAIAFAIASGVGSRGSAMVLDPAGTVAHESLGDAWRFVPENPAFRDKVLETTVGGDGKVLNEWVARRPLPHTDEWFETAWAAFREGKIYE